MSITIGHVPKDVYIANTFEEACEIQCEANACFAGVSMEHTVNPGYRILQHLSRPDLFVIIRHDKVSEGRWAQDYSREG